MTLVNSSVQTDEIQLFLPDSDDIDDKRRNSNKPYQPKLATSFHSLNIIKAQKERWMSRRTKKCLFMLLFLIGFGCLGLIFFGYYCSGTGALCDLPPYKSSTFRHITTDMIDKPLDSSLRFNNLPTFEDVVSKDFQFDIEGHDVMVFLHMQKTGGTTFGRHLVKDLELQRECVCHRKYVKRCTCLRPGTHSEETWLFSRYSTGWKCGVHADWTELTNCVDEVMDKIDHHTVKRRYFYITYLREPIHRYLSEYRHIRRGATWKNTLLYCKGRKATRKEVPLCFEGDNWADATLEEFLSCQSNLAHNRQTRMLADLSLVNCYDKTTMSEKERDTIILASAKNNLNKMAFFGLTEFQEINQYLFEETFNLRFNVRFDQYNTTLAEDSFKEVDPKLMEKVRSANHLDIQLYEYAKELLFKRHERLKMLDTHFSEHFKNMGHMAFSWDQIDKER